MCVCVFSHFFTRIILRIVDRIAYTVLRATFKGFKVKIGAGNRHQYATYMKNHPTTTATAAAAITIIITKNNSQTRRQCLSMVCRWQRNNSKLHVKFYCQKEQFMCIYVIIKIAQLVTYDDYAIRGRTHWVYVVVIDTRIYVAGK